jgi:hypothetical protein
MSISPLPTPGGRADADRRRARQRRLLGIRDGLPAKLDRKARLTGGGGHRDYPVDVGFFQVIRGLGEVHRGVRGAPVRAYLDLAARQVGAGHRGHLRQVGHPRQHRGHPLLESRIGDAAVAHPPDDLVGVARPGRRRPEQQLLGSAGAGAGQCERIVIRRLHCLRHDRQADEQADPGGDDDEAVLVAPASKG